MNTNAESFEKSFSRREYTFKFLIIGDFGVGKTSIIRRYAKGTFSPTYKITIGADFALKFLDLDDYTRINLQLWDIAGHERFGCLTRVYYKYAVAAAIVFDLTRPETYKSVEKWLLDLREKVTSDTGQAVPVILLANKGDVNLSNIPDSIVQFCNENQILAWFITSAKENTRIDEAMNVLINATLQNYGNTQWKDSDSIQLQNTPSNTTTKQSCCIK